MDEIRPDLWIGKLRETLDASLLRANGIGAFLQLSHEVTHPDIVSGFLRVEDGDLLPAQKLEKGLAFIREQRLAGHRVLVACGRGVSRSASYALAALKEDENLSLTDALQAVVKAHPEARPHPVLWKSLCEYYNEPFVLAEMLKICRPVGGWR